MRAAVPGDIFRAAGAHQAAAAEAVKAGKNVVMVTPTASGKTLCYNLPVLNAILENPDTRALYLYPTKALAQDQLAELQDLTRSVEQRADYLSVVEAELRAGFTVLTGETGAGKSILVDALRLALGDRADSDAIRPGAERAEITATFTVNAGSPASDWLRANALPDLQPQSTLTFSNSRTSRQSLKAPISSRLPRNTLPSSPSSKRIQSL